MRRTSPQNVSAQPAPMLRGCHAAIDPEPAGVPPQAHTGLHSRELPQGPARKGGVAPAVVVEGKAGPGVELAVRHTRQRHQARCGQANEARSPVSGTAHWRVERCSCVLGASVCARESPPRQAPRKRLTAVQTTRHGAPADATSTASATVDATACPLRGILSSAWCCCFVCAWRPVAPHQRPALSEPRTYTRARCSQCRALALALGDSAALHRWPGSPGVAGLEP